jgi:limonene-1,2-epoxide hydrolase
MNKHIHPIFGIGTAGMMRWIRHRRSEPAKSDGPATTRHQFLNTIAVALLLLLAVGGAPRALAQSRELRVLYVDIETFPTIVDTRHANKEAIDLLNRFFATKSRHDSDATMEFISRDLSVYVDATLGWELNGYDALKEVWAKYMPTWGEGRSYPTRILGEVNGGTGSVMLEFTDTPELFGADMRVLGTVDVVDGKITRWADYWDSATYDGKRFEEIKRTPSDPPLALRSKPAATSARIRDVASKFVEMVSGGNTAGAATLFSYDGVFEDRSQGFLRSIVISPA